jgi:hypothetical protein
MDVGNKVGELYVCKTILGDLGVDGKTDLIE